jgi:hypothetical protein
VIFHEEIDDFDDDESDISMSEDMSTNMKLRLKESTFDDENPVLISDSEKMTSKYMKESYDYDEKDSTN